MLQMLIDRYGPGAVLNVTPFALDSGETLRWIVQIGGTEVQEVDVRVEEREDTVVMCLTHAGEELELNRWATKRHPHGPAGFVDTLGALQRRTADA
jgi:hypothetical protein